MVAQLALVELGTNLHTKQLTRSRFARTLLVRIVTAIYRELTQGPFIYGLQWGDPDVWTPLQFIRDRYVIPFVNPDQTAVDIGCGGGRWTRYMLGFKTVYAVDYYEPLLSEFRKTFRRHKHVTPIKNNGTDFPGIEPRSVDYIFSFGCFGHINQALIDGYLGHIEKILKPGGNVVIHYSDKNKAMAQDPGFSDNTPEQMRALVLNHGFRIIQEDTTTMWNGSIIHFTN
jgi:SAM-dependent methyltransferase